jgi:hypothetical protein
MQNFILFTISSPQSRTWFSFYSLAHGPTTLLSREILHDIELRRFFSKGGAKALPQSIN